MVTTENCSLHYYVQTCPTTPNYNPIAVDIPFNYDSKINCVVNTDKLVEEDYTKVKSFNFFKEVQSTINQGMIKLETESQNSLKEKMNYTNQVIKNLEVNISFTISTKCDNYTNKQISIALTNANAKTTSVIKSNIYK